MGLVIFEWFSFSLALLGYLILALGSEKKKTLGLCVMLSADFSIFTYGVLTNQFGMATIAVCYLTISSFALYMRRCKYGR